MATYSWTLRCVDADGRQVTLPDSMEVTPAPAAGDVTLTSKTLQGRVDTIRGVESTVTLALTFASNGQLSTNHGFLSDVEWGVGVDGAEYEILVTTSATGVSGPALGTWHSLGTDRTWSISHTAASNSSRSEVLAVSIRDAATLDVVAEADLTLRASVQQLPEVVTLSGGTIRAESEAYFGGGAEATSYLTMYPDGRLTVAEFGSLSPSTEVDVTGEWGQNVLGGNYEVRFTILSGPVGSTGFSPPVGSWGRLDVQRGVSLSVSRASTGTAVGSMLVRAEIRPFGGGTVVASGEYSLEASAVSYPGPPP